MLMVVVGRRRHEAVPNGWDPSQQIQGLQCPSQLNPNKKNIETCSVKLPLPELAMPRLTGFAEELSTLAIRVETTERKDNNWYWSFIDDDDHLYADN